VKNGDRNIPKDSQERVYDNNLGENQGNKDMKHIFDSQLRESIHLFPLLVVNFIGTLGFSIVLPFMVFLVNKLGGNSFIYGLANSMYPTFQLIGAPILGRWSDIHGRKKILLLSQFGTLLSWIIFLLALYLPIETLFKVDSKIFGAFAFTSPIAILFFARALDGLTGGNVSVANAYLADITVEKDRNLNFGKMAISENLGFIVGPALAGILSVTEYGDAAPVFGAIIISFIGTLLVMFYIPKNKECYLKEPESTGKMEKIYGYLMKECKNTREIKKPGFKEVFELPNIPYMFFLYFLIFLGFIIFYTSFPLHAIAVLNWDIAQMGIYFTVLSALLIIVQVAVLPKASKRYPDSTLIIFGSLMLMINFLLLIPGNCYLTYLATGFFALGDGLMWPSFLSLLSKITGEGYQGTIQGFACSFAGLASITGLILGGLLYEMLAGGSFLIVGVVIFFVFYLTSSLDILRKNYNSDPLFIG
jgi:MFS transporter, DHA1 family, tetracycline resistance protein